MRALSFAFLLLAVWLFPQVVQAYPASPCFCQAPSSPQKIHGCTENHNLQHRLYPCWRTVRCSVKSKVSKWRTQLQYVDAYQVLCLCGLVVLLVCSMLWELPYSNFWSCFLFYILLLRFGATLFAHLQSGNMLTLSTSFVVKEMASKMAGWRSFIKSKLKKWQRRRTYSAWRSM